MMKEKLVDVTAVLRHETDAAYLIDDGVNKVWVAKSQVEINDDGTITMPERLAQEKGLI